MVRLTRLSLEHPGRVGLLALAVSVALGAGALRLRTDVGFRAYVGPDHPTVAQFDRFVERFGGGAPMVAVWSCVEPAPCESVFDPAALRMAGAVVSALDGVQGIGAIDSPATSTLLVPSGQGFDLRRFVEDGRLAPDRARLSRRALIDPLWVGSLVSPDGRHGAIAIEVASSRSDVHVDVFRALRAALEPFEAQGFRYHLVGDTVMFVVAGGDLQRDSARLVPVIVALIGATLVVLFRSWRVAFAALSTVGVAVVWSFGLMGWLDWPQTAVTQALAPFILVIGVCNAIHLIARHATESAAAPERSRRAVLCGVARDVGGACAVASLTTAAGFASFATSRAVSFAHFGALAAFGVLSALLLSFTVLPILLARLEPPRHGAARASAVWSGALELVADAAGRRRGLVLAVALLVAVASAFGARDLRLEGDANHLFGENSRVVRWIRFVEENLRKTFTLEVSLAIPDGRRFEDPAVLRDVERFSSFLSRQEGLGEARTVLVPLGWLNRVLHGDRPEFQRPGRDPIANAELHLLMSLHDPRALDRWLSLDMRHLRVSVDAEEGSDRRRAALLSQVRDFIEHELSDGWRGEITGTLKLTHDMLREVQRTQLTSFATAALVVFAIVALFLRSLPWSLAAMIPTLLPVLVTLGAMGRWGICLDMGTAMVAAIVLGVAIDDSVHLLVQYRRRRAAGRSATDAMRGAVLHVGRAVVTTSLALALGFFALTLSSWESVASFGFLAGLAVLGAMMADLLVLPALVTALSPARRGPGSGA